MPGEHRICALGDLSSPGKKSAKVDGVRLLLLRTGDEVFAIENRCPHLNVPLSTGKWDGTQITCRFHRARFDVRSGEMDRKAFLLSGAGGNCLKKFEAEVRDGDVYVTV